MDIVEYRGWKNNLRLANGDAELIVTLDVGPRVIRYSLPGGVNVFKNYDSHLGGAGEAEWQLRGGHRFWLAPEDLTRTYFPDNRPVKHETVGPESRSEEHTSELQSQSNLVCRLLLEKKKNDPYCSLLLENSQVLEQL